MKGPGNLSPFQVTLCWAVWNTTLVATWVTACRDQLDVGGLGDEEMRTCFWEGPVRARPVRGLAGGSTAGARWMCEARVYPQQRKEKMWWGTGLPLLLGEAFVATFALGREITSEVTRGNRQLPNLER